MEKIFIPCYREQNNNYVTNRTFVAIDTIQIIADACYSSKFVVCYGKINWLKVLVWFTIPSIISAVLSLISATRIEIWAFMWLPILIIELIPFIHYYRYKDSCGYRHKYILCKEDLEAVNQKDDLETKKEEQSNSKDNLILTYTRKIK